MTTRKEDETYLELATRMEYFMEKWLTSCTSVKDVKQRFVIEQFLTSLSTDIRIWVREKVNRRYVLKLESWHTLL